MRFQQKQQTEREQKKVDLLGTTSRPLPKLSQPAEFDDTKLLTSSLGAGKVRQMFEERRDREKVGVDKAYPLKPISGNERVLRAANTEPVRAPLKPTRVNGNTSVRTKPIIHDNDHIRSSFDRDPLNNTVVPSYTSTNRVPSLKSNHNNNNYYTSNGSAGSVGVGKIKPASPSAPKTTTVQRKATPFVAPPTNSSVRRVEQQPLTVVSSASPKKVAPVPPPEGMKQCQVCGRNFLEERIAKHETICSKTVTKKRKVFDSTKHRVAGTEAEVYVKKASKTKTKAPEKPTKKGDWRKKHEEFIQAIRAGEAYF